VSAPSPPLRLRSWRIWAAALAGLALVEAANLTQAWLTGTARVPITPGLVLHDLIYWYSWVAVSPIVFFVSRRYRLDRQPVRSLGVHAVAALGAFALAALIRTLVRWPIFGLRLAFLDVWQLAFASSLPTFLLLYTLTAMLFYAIEYYDAYHARELHASQLETMVARAELDALRNQLQPHFLFNTLHAISALMTRDVQTARKMMARFSDLLRVTLDEPEQHEVPLAQELGFLEQYLDLQRMRFGDRLTVTQQIAPEALRCMVPRLVLQPIVENALTHGIGARAAGGTLAIAAEVEDHAVRLRVSDDGPGLDGQRGSLMTEGVGLRNTRARLKHLYGPDSALELHDNPGGGLCVTLTIPSCEVARQPVSISRSA
jgi:sensor histidine kinase YesM